MSLDVFLGFQPFFGERWPNLPLVDDFEGVESVVHDMHVIVRYCGGLGDGGIPVVKGGFVVRYGGIVVVRWW